MTDSLDLESLRELKDIMEDEFEALVTTFISDTELKIPKLEQAIADNDAQEIRELAHSIKGSSSNLGALKLANFCLTLEEQSQKGDLTQAVALKEEILTEFDQVKTLLNQEL